MKELHGPTKHWEKHYAFLDEADREDPVRVIKEFASQTSIFDWRNALWQLIYATIGSSVHEDDSPLERRSMLYNYYLLLRLAEAACYIDELIDNQKILYDYRDMG